MVRTFGTGFVDRPLWDVTAGGVRYLAKVSYLDTTTGLQFEETVEVVALDTDSAAQLQTKYVAAVKAGGEAHGLTMTGTVAFLPTYGKVTF